MLGDKQPLDLLLSGLLDPADEDWVDHDNWDTTEEETVDDDCVQVCAGMNGNSLQGAAGVGAAVANWIVKGYPPGDMLPFEVAEGEHKGRLAIAVKLRKPKPWFRRLL